MYSRFKIEDFTVNEENVRSAKNYFETKKNDIRTSLNDYINEDGYLDCSELESEWFPNIPCDVFISHSHADEEKAMSLAG